MPPFRCSGRLRSLFSASIRRLYSSSSTPSLDEVGPMACRLETRAVIRLRGPDTIKFLQGLLTNDVRPLAGPSTADDQSTKSSYLPTPNVPFRSAPPVYAAMLTPQGRFLYDLFLYRPPQPDEKLDRTGSAPGSDDQEVRTTVLADVDALFLDELLDCFKRYRLRSKVEIENAAKEFYCWQRFGGNLGDGDSSAQDPEAASFGWERGADPAAASAVQGDNDGWRWFKDPRLKCLGFRGIFPANSTPPHVESDKETEEEHFLLWRLERGIAEGSTEIPKGEAIPLEFNLAGLNAISFDKGCYIGQELVARTHHRGVIRKRLLPLKFVDENGREQEVSPGSEIVDSSSQKKAGTVRTALGCRGMGLLKLEEAFKQPPSLIIKEKAEVRVEVIRPNWWPSDWLQVHEQRSAVA